MWNSAAYSLMPRRGLQNHKPPPNSRGQTSRGSRPLPRGTIPTVPRRLLNLLTVLSLLLCLAAAAVWTRSYFRYDILSVHPGSAWMTFQVRLGEVTILFASDRSKLNTPRGLTTNEITDRSRWTHAALLPPNGWRRFGFGYGTQPFPSPAAGAGPVHTIFHVARIPCWALVAGFGLLPTVWSVRRFLRRGRARGLCPTCGYNLTANVSGVCPECGRNTT